MIEQAQAVGFVAFGFASLLGIGAGAVGLFVLRHEYNRELDANRREHDQLRDELRAVRAELAERGAGE